MSTPSEAQIETERRALELRRAGWSFQQIADQLGYANRGSVHRVIQRALKRTLVEPADALRQLENERQDQMQAALWKFAMRGEVKAVLSVTKIMERRAKLNGLDLPTKHEITGPGGNPIVVELSPDVMPDVDADG